VTATLDIFKALSDEVRLRILRALFSAELSVAELVTVLKLPQSTVSRHLKPLRDADLVESRREGTSVYYRRGSALQDLSFFQMLDGRVKEVAGAAGDLAAVRRVLESRRRKSREFFDRVAGRYGTLTQPGGGWEALASILAAGFADRTVVDLGAGEGGLTLLLARYARITYAVDQSPRMLTHVAEKAAEHNLDARVQTVEGDLEEVPLPANVAEAVFLSQALHHAARPEAAVKEAARLLKPGGWLLILDLARHEQEWVREEWADQWLGFDEVEIKSWLDSAGLMLADLRRLPGATPELGVLLAAARKPTSPTND